MNKIDINILKEFFEYKNGELFWKKYDKRKKLNKEVGWTNKTTGYREVRLKGKCFKVHRIIFAIHKNYWPTMVDHIDGDILNNSIENLRECTKSQNQFNSKKPITNTSGVKGVYFHKASGKWQVSINYGGQLIHLGLFENKQEAILVRRKAAEKYHKEFVNHGEEIC